MKVHFTDQAWDDYQHWIRSDRGVLEKTNAVIEDARRNLFKGIGKPEPLKGDLSGWWSRRITGDHRLVYRIEGKPNEDQRIEIAACRYHYGE